jgi:hypothetical protein
VTEAQQRTAELAERTKAVLREAGIPVIDPADDCGGAEVEVDASHVYVTWHVSKQWRTEIRPHILASELDHPRVREMHTVTEAMQGALGEVLMAAGLTIRPSDHEYRLGYWVVVDSKEDH